MARVINTDDRESAEVLMESLQEIENTKRIVILLEKPDSLTVKTNCTYKELKWILDQAAYCTMKELFTTETEE